MTEVEIFIIAVIKLVCASVAVTAIGLLIFTILQIIIRRWTRM